MIELCRDAYKNRELIWALAMKDLKIRYKRSVLGFLWALLNPALLMVVLTIVFSVVMRTTIPHYSIFLLSMLVPWTFFAQSLAYGTESIIANGDLLRKVSVAKVVFPLAAVVANVINFLLSLIPLGIILAVVHHPFYLTLYYLPIPIVILCIFSTGMAFMLATANVYYRDVSHVIQILLQAWMYLTPILYSTDTFPAQYRWLFHLNPMTYVLNGFRLSIYYGMLPQLQSLLASLACAIVSLIVGYAIFRRHQSDFVYYI